MDVDGWLVLGLVATAGLTCVLVGAQLAGWTRLDIPMLLGTIWVEDPDRARVLGAVVHVVNGQAFALGYALVFAVLDHASWELGAALGLLHGLVAMIVFVPLMPGFHPRMGSVRSGRAAGVTLEPPGLLALNYGRRTPALTIAAHVIYGAALGVLLEPH